MLQALAGYDPLDPSTVPVPVPDYSEGLGGDLSGLTAGIPSNYFFDEVDSEVETSVRNAIAALQELGVKVVDVSLPSMEYVGALRAASLSDGVVTHEPYLASDRDKYGPNVIYRTLAGQFVLGRDYSRAMKVQRLIKEEYARVLQGVDFIVTPTTPVPAPRIDAVDIETGRRDPPGPGPRLRVHLPQHQPHERQRPAGHHRALRLQRRGPAHRRPVHWPPLR